MFNYLKKYFILVPLVITYVNIVIPMVPQKILSKHEDNTRTWYFKDVPDKRIVCSKWKMDEGNVKAGAIKCEEIKPPRERVQIGHENYLILEKEFTEQEKNRPVHAAQEF